MTTQRKKKLFVDDEDDYWHDSTISTFSFDLESSGSLPSPVDDYFDITVPTNSSLYVKPSTVSSSNLGTEEIEVVSWNGLDVKCSVRSKSPSDLSQASDGIATAKKGNSTLTSLSTTDYSPLVSRTTPSPRRQCTPQEFADLEKECRRLERKMEHLNRNKFRDGDVEDILKRMLRGESYVLELFKSKEEKVKLLDTAIKYGDGDAILSVVLFLKSTLAFSLFQEQLLLKPQAANEYLNFLRESEKFEELKITLFSLGRKEDAAMLEFYLASKKKTSEAKISALKKCIQSSMGCDPMLDNECNLVTEYVSLLERQQPIDASDDKVIAEGKNQKFVQIPKSVSLIDQPVITTLYYCCLYHYELPENSFACPLAIKKHHRLSDKQFVWIAVKALGRLKQWLQIEALLTGKNLFGSSKIILPFPSDKLIDILSKFGAPLEILNKYVRLITDVDKRMQVALETQCHDVVVDCFVTNKDRQGLIAYRSKLTPHTKESYYADGALQNTCDFLLTPWMLS